MVKFSGLQSTSVNIVILLICNSKEFICPPIQSEEGGKYVNNVLLKSRLVS